MHTIFLFIYIMCLSFGIACFFERKIEETIPVSIFETIMLLFVFGVIFDDLKIAFDITIVLNSLIVTVAIVFLLKKKRAISMIKENCLTNGAFIFAIMFVWIYVITRGFVVKGFDEYSHWATVVKNMTFFDKFGNYEFSTTNKLFPGYPPGASLWQYFCCRMYGKYHEGTLYQAYDLMIISCIMPVCSKFRLRKIINSCGVICVLSFVPISFYYGLYNSLYVDAMLGYVMAYALYLVYDCYKKKNGSFYIELILSLSVLCLIKASGVFLAIIVIATLLVCQCRDEQEKNYKFKQFWKTIISAACIIFLGKVLWSVHLNRTSTRTAWNTSSITLSSIIGLFRGEGKEYQYITIKNFVKFLYTDKLFGGIIDLNYIEVTLLLVGLIIVIFFVNKKDKEWLQVAISLFVGQIVYTLGMLVLYIFTFGEAEAVALASNTRYLNTYFVGFLLFVIMIMLTKGYDNHLIEYGFLLIAFLGVVFSNFASIKNLTFKYKEYVISYEYVRDKYEDLANSCERLDYKKDKIGMVTLDENHYESIAAYYYMTPISTGVFYDFGLDRKNYGLLAEEWLDELMAEDMSHMYILSIDDHFISTYGSCFGDIPHKGMYYIDKEKRMLTACE